jgi:two-component system response regulator DevR
MPSSTIRIVLIEDSELVRVGLRTLLANYPEFEVVGEGASVSGSAELCARLRPDLVLLDIRLPDGTGFDACRRIIEDRPETRVIFLTSVVDDTLLAEAIRAGAHGYLLKEIDSAALVNALRESAEGKSILDPAVTARVLQLVRNGAPGSAGLGSLESLSPQEKRVLSLIAAGRTNKEVAMEMKLSDKTVKNYLSNVFEKLNVSRRAQAAAIYARQKPSA